jgi:hypothetical protein
MMFLHLLRSRPWASVHATAGHALHSFSTHSPSYWPRIKSVLVHRPAPCTMCPGFFSDFNRLLVLPGLLPARSPTVIEWKERWSSENKKGRWWSNSSGKGNWQRARKSGGWAKGGRATDLPARGWFTRCYRSSGLPIMATTALRNKTELGCAALPELPERSMGTNSSRKNTNSSSQKDHSNSRTEPYQSKILRRRKFKTPAAKGEFETERGSD